MLRVWVLKQAFNYFLDIRTKCNADIKVKSVAHTNICVYMNHQSMYKYFTNIRYNFDDMVYSCSNVAYPFSSLSLILPSKLRLCPCMSFFTPIIHICGCAKQVNIIKVTYHATLILFQVSPTPSQESLVSQHSGQSGEDPGSLDPTDDGSAPFMPKPFCVYTGHSADMLDISWSKVDFFLQII